MRQRKKHNSEARIQQCGDYLLRAECPSNSLVAVQVKEYFDWKEVFPRRQPLSLEIGCGKGSFAIGFARRHPDKNLIAVERNMNVLIDALEGAAQANVDTVRFLHLPCECLPRFIQPHCLEAVYLNFSTPLPKSPNIRQRLTHPRFLSIYDEMLLPDGKIYLKTDSEMFFEFSVEQMTKYGFSVLRAERDLYASDLLADNIQTEYERRFVNMGLPIYEIIAQKNEVK